MAERRDRRRDTMPASERLKFEVAEDVGVPLEKDGDNGDLTARQLGKVGGNMVRRLVELGEEELEERSEGEGE